MTARQTGYRTEIDGLRALAVIAVIINHFDKTLLPSGYLGVDVFFVISGFVITASVTERTAPDLRTFLLGFFERRIKRLLPALIVCVVITSFAITLLDPNPKVSLQTGILSLFGASNLYLLYQSTDYFAPSAEANVFTQTWSLSVEEQFYLIFPFIFWFTKFRCHRDGFGRLFWVIFLLSVVSLSVFIFLNKLNPAASYFLMPSRLWELSAGSMLYIFLSNKNRIKPELKGNLWPLIWILALVVTLFAPVQFALQATVFAVLFTLLILANVSQNSFAFYLLNLGFFQYIGIISYSLYLWHWSILSLARWSIGVTLWTAPILVATMFFFAAASYKFIEMPLRHSKWSTTAFRTILYGLGSSFIAAGVVLTFMSNFYIPHSPSVVNSSPAFLPLKASGLPYAENCVVNDSEMSIKPNTFGLCTVRPITGAQTLWVMGDSHAGHLQGLLHTIHETTGIGVHLIETPGVPFPLNGTKSRSREVIFEEAIKRAEEGDIILVARLFLDRYTFEMMHDVPTWATDVSLLAQQVQMKGLKIIVMGPLPIFQFESPKSCEFFLFGRSRCDIKRSLLTPAVESVHRTVLEKIVKQPNAFLFNQFDIFCPKSGTVCSPTRENAFMFRDKDHLNSGGSALLSEPFIGFLRINGLLKAQ